MKAITDDPRFMEILAETEHFGMARDQYFAEQIPVSKQCERCGGTGNELLYMYRECSDCGGSGKNES